VIGHSDFHTSPDLILTEDTNGVNAGMGNLHIIHLYFMYVKITLQGNFCDMFIVTNNSAPTTMSYFFEEKPVL
jgi:hypothetical protein